MNELLGIIVIGAWVWSVIILAHKTKGTTNLEKVVLATGVTGFVLFFIGSL